MLGVIVALCSMSRACVCACAPHRTGYSLRQALPLPVPQVLQGSCPRVLAQGQRLQYPCGACGTPERICSSVQHGCHEALSTGGTVA